MYDLTMKYILPIGYHNVNLFLLDWSSDDYGNLCFNDLLDYLYRLKYNDYLYARDYHIEGRSFVVKPVFKDDSANTFGAILLRLMQADCERKP